MTRHRCNDPFVCLGILGCRGDYGYSVRLWKEQVEQQSILALPRKGLLRKRLVLASVMLTVSTTCGM